MSARPAAVLPEGGAEDYDHLAPAVWNPVGNALAAAADILVGERVLDVFAGVGAATIPAAQLAGPAGHVDAVDPDAAMLGLIGAKAEAVGLGNVSLHQDDPARWTPEAPYDALLSCHGIFLLQRLDLDTDRLLGLLRPGGRIALSVWEEAALEPLGELLRTALGTSEVPDGAGNSHRLSTAARLQDWCSARGLTEISVDTFGLSVPADPDTAWALALGSGHRDLLPGDPEELRRVREEFTGRLESSGPMSADSLIAVGTRSH